MAVNLEQVAHRAWPLPAGSWVMAQSWHDLLFAHWPLREAVLRPHIPARLEIDTHDGQAWLGVVPFRMSGVRLRGTPNEFQHIPSINEGALARLARS